MVFEDTRARTRNATYITIASQMQYHTQRLAKAAGHRRARPADRVPAGAGQPRRVRQLPRRSCRTAASPSASTCPAPRTNEELRSRLEELAQRWPESSSAGHRDPRRAEATSWRSRRTSRRSAWAPRRWRPCRRSSPASCRSRARRPAQVLRANRLTFLAERLGPRLGGDPRLRDHRSRGAVPHRQGHQRPARADPRARDRQRARSASSPMRDAEARAKLAELKKQFGDVRAERGPDPARAAEARDRRARRARSWWPRIRAAADARWAACRKRIQAEKPVAHALRDRRASRRCCSSCWC